MKKVLVGILALMLILPGMALAKDAIKIGFNIPLTGDSPDVGESSKQAGEMLKQQINSAGGIKVGDKAYDLVFIYEHYCPVVS
jgi:branched-chain amino acid transport system substrate-binding protein